MKRIITLAALMLAVSISAFSQAKKPTIMVVPSDAWCNANGCLTVIDNQGVEVYNPNYQKAIVTCPELIPVISRINGLMADRGFPLKNLETVLKNINSQTAELSAVQAKDGSSVQTNDLMLLRQAARADIIIQITWNVNKIGPKQSVTFTMQGLDSYTGKEIASSTGTGEPSFSTEVPVMLSEAVNAHIDEFCSRLQNHFDDMFVNGRTIALKLNIFPNDNDINFESEYGEGADKKELREIIEDWMSLYTVNKRFNLSDDAELYMNFEDVRIPLYDDKDRPIAANAFARNLSKYLKTTYGIEPIKILNQGLGQCTLILFNK